MELTELRNSKFILSQSFYPTFQNYSVFVVYATGEVNLNVKNIN